MVGGSEHHFRRVIAGDLDTVRQRLSDVLEDFGYIVLGETPIQAKRPRQKNIWVAMVLDYDTKLTIALKPISPASTLAIFDYAIEQLFTKGEMQALEREAEAIIALANTTSIEVFCPSCGAENPRAGRFCRACGKPGPRNALPSELEVMRLTALASGTQIEITLGLILCLLTLALTLPMILLSDSEKGVSFGWLLLGLGELLGFYFLILGMRRLHKALNPTASPQPEATSEQTGALSMQERAALPSPPPSIVEGTTELMTPQKAPVVVRRARETDSLE
ncbi:MAG TPA: zinc ribbon domain-containing protein [Blastocatellia bacterium]|nr:zinc ribbon domain-containing protein [Blastocatellia bacterium]